MKMENREIGKVVSGGGVCGYKKETGGIIEEIEYLVLYLDCSSINILVVVMCYILQDAVIERN